MSQFENHTQALEDIELEMYHRMKEFGDALFYRSKMKKLGSKCDVDELRSKLDLIEKIFETRYKKDLAKCYLEIYLEKSKTPTHKKISSTRHEIKKKILEFKDEVKLSFLEHMEEYHDCDYVKIVNHYFEEKNRDILRSKVKESLFENIIQATPKKSIFSFFTRRKSTPSITKSQLSSHKRTPSKKVAGKIIKRRHRKTH